MNDVLITGSTLVLFGAILGPVISALIYLHRRNESQTALQTQTFKEQVIALTDSYNTRMADLKEERNFYRTQSDTKDTTQLEAILGLREGIVAVRGMATDMTNIKTQLNILTDKVDKLTASVGSK
jgi:hypothetical protein